MDKAKQQPVLADTGFGDAGDKDLGEKLRSYRLRRKLTLKEAAAAADMSIGSLSQIERGISSPSMRTLRALCHALDVDGAALFGGRERASTSSEFALRVADRRAIRLKDGAVTKYRVTPPSCASMEAYLLELAPGATSDPNFLVQVGDKIGYVLSGRLKLFVDDTILLLEEGDSYGFPADHRYRWQNGWDGPTRFLVVNSNHFYV